MGLLRTVLKAGLAKKLFDEARKPANQARAKDLYRSLSKKGRGGPATGRTSRP